MALQTISSWSTMWYASWVFLQVVKQVRYHVGFKGRRTDVPCTTHQPVVCHSIQHRLYLALSSIHQWLYQKRLSSHQVEVSTGSGAAHWLVRFAENMFSLLQPELHLRDGLEPRYGL